MTDTVRLDRPGAFTAPEQPCLDLPEPAPAIPDPSAPKPARGKKPRMGLPPAAYGLAALGVALALWGAWVTKNIVDPAVVKAPIASVRLEQLVGEYVQAQARSAAPSELVARQTQAFMTTLGSELEARGTDGTTVLVGEAVLSRNVPDITDEVRAAIYAKVPPPGAAGARPGGAVDQTR